MQTHTAGISHNTYWSFQPTKRSTQLSCLCASTEPSPCFSYVVLLYCHIELNLHFTTTHASIQQRTYVPTCTYDLSPSWLLNRSKSKCQINPKRDTYAGLGRLREVTRPSDDAELVVVVVVVSTGACFANAMTSTSTACLTFPASVSENTSLVKPTCNAFTHSSAARDIRLVSARESWALRVRCG
jgi:hypothetical protein